MFARTLSTLTFDIHDAALIPSDTFVRIIPIKATSRYAVSVWSLYAIIVKGRKLMYSKESIGRELMEPLPSSKKIKNSCLCINLTPF